MLVSPARAGHVRPGDYPGSPLEPGQIRLIKVLPGTWSEPVRCELFNVLLSTAEYQALSYVWGSRNVSRNIVVNDRTYPATVNLESALRHLRERYPVGIVLWVDALCINQNDTEERMHQVQLMGHIYKMCKKVVVYLGDRLDGATKTDLCPPAMVHFDRLQRHDEVEPLLQGLRGTRQDMDVLNVFRFLQRLSMNVHLDKVPDLGLSVRRDEILQSEKATCEDIDGQTSEQLRAHAQSLEQRRRHRTCLIEGLRRLMHHPYTPWWNRIWVIQEVVSPPMVDIVYGGCSAPWDLFTCAAQSQAKHSTLCCTDSYRRLPRDLCKVLEDFCQRVTGIDELRTAHKWLGGRPREPRPGARSLLDLLRKFRNRKASDPRDKVYALLCLVEPEEGDLAPMLPNYNLTESEAFIQATLQCIYASRSLSVFSTELGRKFRGDLPSWVPDWGAPGGYAYTVRARVVELYDACPSDKPIEELVHLSDMSRLKARGFEFETIQYQGETMWGDEADSCRKTLANWWSYIADVSSSSSCIRTYIAAGKLYSYRCRPYTSFWRLICGDVISRPQGDCIVRRAVARDELHFVAWSLESSRSPFRDKPEIVHKGLWSRSAEAYRVLLLLWPQLAVPAFGVFSRVPRDYFPQWQPRKKAVQRDDLSKLSDEQDKQTMITRLLQASCLDKIFSVQDLIDKALCFRESGPWQELYEAVTQKLLVQFDLDRSSKLYSTKDDISMIDNSIMAATLSRRLIVGKYHVEIGLGPADARVGDQLCFFEAGKTPFVVRRRNGDDQSRLGGLDYEVIGDCYIQELMDGQSNRDWRTREWRDLTLV
ncbi:heterokaryon incompatibility protein [Stagonosporopsis vannaccii]|nr:heterokaryon incompatibility protein [Stagonosporopsis vannaccii]